MEKPTESRVTLKSLAAITNLGISTVSQALRNSPEISIETRRRVQLAAKQAGYRPNRAGVRLRTGKTSVITVVLNAADGGANFFSDFVYGISDGLKDSNYHLVVTPYSLSDPMEPIRYIVETQSADGVILSRTQRNDPRVRFLVDNNIPFATHGRTEMDIEHPYHDYDNEAFAKLATDKLAERGRMNIAFIGPPPDLTYHKHAHLGFDRGIKANGQSVFPLGQLNIDMPLDDARKAAAEIAMLTNRPDGIICISSPMAIAVMVGMQDAGLEIGKDFDIVSKQTTELTNLVGQKVIAIPEDFREAGFSTARKVIAAIAGEPVETLQKVVTPKS